VDPVALGLCKQTELDEAVRKASAKKAKATGVETLTDEEKLRLMTTDQSLAAAPESRLPSSMIGLENFSLTDPRDRGGFEDDDPRGTPLDADTLFNLPAEGFEDDEDEDDDADRKRR
jgi:hypothetical protein